ncbi:MAG: cell division protein FtsW [Parcubacteria group bacterium]|nr:cell division protein FtsW [Parcubacteria group bacterium]
MKPKPLDKIFLAIVLLLSLGGFFLFTSASLGLLARDSGANFSSVFFNQVFFGLFGGFCALSLLSHLHYKHIRRLSFYFFCGALFLSILVFVPGIGMEHGGARRWIDLGFVSFQPSEFLKLGFVLYFAAWLAFVKDKIQSFRYGTLPLLLLLGIAAALLLLEPDTGTFGIVAIAGAGMFFLAGGRIMHLLLLAVLAVLAFGGLVHVKPYVKERVLTFIDPSRDPYGAGYQLNQSLIAVGSGGVFGRGFGQSIQKFNFLPEPTNDAVYAVASEEFGFAGSTSIILVFLLFVARGFHIASRAPDTFSRLVVTGIVLLIIAQSFVNIASMLGLFPLTGVPLLFVSHGGTALLFVLAEVGIILNISRWQVALRK